MLERKKTKVINLGGVLIGGNNPVTIQSMTNTPTADVQKTIAQIRRLIAAGCELVRVTANTTEAAKAIKNIKKQISIPIIADIHFDHKLALEAIAAGVDGLRLNPGNIGSEANVKKVVEAAKANNIPIRIGVNSGSLSKEKVRKYGVTAEAIVESALEHVAILERENYHNLKISVKASSVPLTINSYRLLSSKVDYPLHLGVTEAGTTFAGTIKSSVGIGTLLAEGIGDTIRVSLTADPVQEILVAKQILKSLDMRKGLEIVSCPTCGRTEIDLIGIAEKVEKELEQFADEDISVAVMGCVVNGPGESKHANIGISLPGTGEHPVAPVYEDGKKTVTLKGDGIAQEFERVIDAYVVRSYRSRQ
ncbi:MAG: flavodoxin-dependent (E)-4-hydroxy-3-methylbut-2-enyl-diphosphate synthase [Candidatus Cloacimonetes bacterium]|nr:flavodoxin-dependent (E)-4-hydroxy-3-methylbut-2-enyl-diphosphate synthase [Candidatus Cloacimonadota bacterium]